MHTCRTKCAGPASPFMQAIALNFFWSILQPGLIAFDLEQAIVNGPMQPQVVASIDDS